MKSKSAETLRMFPIKRFWKVLKARLFKLGLKKARKVSQFSKRYSKELLYLQRTPFGVFFLYTGTELEINKKPPYLPQSNVTVENRVVLER